MLVSFEQRNRVGGAPPDGYLAFGHGDLHILLIPIDIEAGADHAHPCSTGIDQERAIQHRRDLEQRLPSVQLNLARAQVPTDRHFAVAVEQHLTAIGQLQRLALTDLAGNVLTAVGRVEPDRASSNCQQ
ncbi:hypothetical protein D3C79_953670 [compost metagenome]